MKERETDTHPCDHHESGTCMCKGACTCHWVEMPEDWARAIINLRTVNEAFYWFCFNHGIGSSAHSFLEFNGVMKVHVDLLEMAARAGIDPQKVSEHTGIPLPVEDHHMAYLGEKLRCIFGPTLDSNPGARAILLEKLFGIREG